MKSRILTVFLSMIVVWSSLDLRLMAKDLQGAWRDWNSVLTLRVGQKVQVTPRGGMKKVKGVLVSADMQGITVGSKAGQQMIPREDVKEVKSVQIGREKYGLAGGLAILGGSAVSLGLTLRDVQEVSAGRFPKERGVGSEILIGVAPVAAGGVLAILGGYKTVYRNPQP